MLRDQSARVQRLATGRMIPLLAEFSWPALVSMTLNALYNVVDRFYIGQACGMDAIAGLAMTFPVMMIFASFGVLIGIGSGSLLSIKLGENNRIDAEKTLGQCVALKVLLGLLLPPLLFFNLDAILRFSGAFGVSTGSLGVARQYLQIVLFFQLFAHLAFGLAGCIRSEGSPRQSMTCMIIGFGANLILDPLFIFVFGWGVAGAAWATNVAMILSCAWALRHYWGGHSVVRLRLRRIWVYPSLAIQALGIGLSPFLQQFTGAAINFSLNFALAKWALDKSAATVNIASFGIFQTVMLMSLMPVMGVQQGLGPILGYNWGARNFARVRQAFLVGLAATSCCCVAAWIIQMVFAYPLTRCFAGADEADLLRVAPRTLRLANLMIWLIGLNIVTTTFYQSTGRPRVAILLSLLRQGICLLPCIWLLPYIFSDPVFGVWLSLPASDVLSFLTTLPVFLRELRFLASGGYQRMKSQMKQ